ncbi:hypothetical protein MNBD_GAMMA12-3058 [hydrothermal vent metagenome]|uniref:Analog of CcoH, COG3198 n=1 Tax=hydrothermal vent metagenome TaxID=652676 RepID=A0A3B0Y6S2_9ZZZZ
MSIEVKNLQKPWYRQPLVWLVISIPATSVVLGFTLLTLAINTDDSLVVDDYYTKGKHINRVLIRDQYAVALGLSGSLVLNKKENVIYLKLHSKLKMKTTNLTLSFLHPTRKKQDRKLTLTPTETPLQYKAPLPLLKDGRWYAQVESRRWRLTAEFRLPTNSPISLQANH